MSRSRTWLRRLPLWAALAALAVWSVFPFWWAATYALKRPANLYDGTVLPILQFLPTGEHWRAEWDALLARDGLGQAMLTGVEVGLGVVAVSLALGLLAAVGLLRLGRTDRRLALAALGLLVVPRLLLPSAVVAPFFLLGRATGLHDTMPWLVAMQSTLALPFAAVILQQAAGEIPHDLLEAAQLDGASWPRIALQVMLPLLAPALVASGVVAFATSWNEFLYATVNHAQRVLTPPVAIMLLEDRDGIPFAHVGSHLTMVILPPVLLTLFAQRYIVRGLSLGAVHGR